MVTISFKRACLGDNTSFRFRFFLIFGPSCTDSFNFGATSRFFASASFLWSYFTIEACRLEINSDKIVRIVVAALSPPDSPQYKARSFGVRGA
jgi:hypothetical protein